MKTKTLLIIIGLFFAAMLSVVALLVGSYVSAKNYGVRTENGLTTKLQDNENIYAQGTQAIIEIAKVPGMYKKDLIEIVKADIQGRYGPDGSQATFQWLKERNLPIDQTMYRAIQQEIVAFRNRFEKSQREILDMRNMYQNQLGYFWSGFWLNMAGYPKIDLKQFDIVTTDKARQTFDTKRDSGIDLPQ